MKINGNVPNTNPRRQYGINPENGMEGPGKAVGEQKTDRTSVDVSVPTANENIRTQIHDRFISSQGAQNEISQLQATDTALGEAQNALQGILNDPMNNDIGAVAARIDDIAANSNFNEASLLGNNFTESLGLRGGNAENAKELASSAMERINNRRAEVGEEQNRLQQALSRAMDNRAFNMDTAKDMIMSIKDRMMANTANALQAQGNSIPQGVLQLVD